MRGKKTSLIILTVLTMFLFLFPQVVLAAPPWLKTGAAGGGEPNQESTQEAAYEDPEGEEEDLGPAWMRGEHPSLKGLRNAFGNVSANGASPVAQAVLQMLIEARSVPDAVYGLEEAVDDQMTLNELTGDEEVQSALVAESERLKKEYKNSCKNDKELARGLIKLGKIQQKLGDCEAAEETLVESAGLNAEDPAVYQSLDELYSEVEGAGMPVFIKGKKTSFDVPPQVVQGRAMVPLRVLAEKLDCTVSWDPENRVVVFTRDGVTVELYVDSKTATINGQQVTLDAPALVKNGRVLVPLRFISESMQAQVDYYSGSSMVVVN